MNILIVSDSFLRGGLEEQIINHVITFKKEHQFYFAFTNYQERDFFKDYQVFRLHAGRGMLVEDVTRDVDRLCKIIKEQSIDLIEVHPFYSFVPVMFAANLCNIPVFHTIHGAPSIIYDYRFIPLTLQRFFISEYASYITTPNHLFDFTLKSQYHVRNLAFLPNTIDMSQYAEIKYDPDGHFALFSRLDQDKLPYIKKILELVSDVDFSLDIYGDGDCADRIKDFIEKQGTSKKVFLKGWTDNIAQALATVSYAGVIGGSRVALEGLAANLPTLLVGWDKISGFIDEPMYRKIKDYNISNRALPEVSPSEIGKQLEILHKTPEKYRLRHLVEAEFDNSIQRKSFNAIAKRAEPTYANVLDVFIKKVQTMFADARQKEPFFESNTVDDHLRDAFKNNFVTNPSIIDLLRTRELERENALLRSDLYATNLSLGAVIAKQQETAMQRLHKKAATTKQRLSNFTAQSKRKIRKNLHPPKLALVLCVYNEAKMLPYYLKYIEPHVDFIIALDDGSTDETVKILESSPKLKYLIKNTRRPQLIEWDEGSNREKLLRVAHEQGADWVIALDPDERFETNFLQNLRAIVNDAPRDVVYGVHFRELWGKYDQYRDDGLWGKKLRYCLFPLSAQDTYKVNRQKIHTKWYPDHLLGHEVVLDYNIYHLKMIQREARAERTDLYNRLDPEHDCQPMGYDYLSDETNLHLQKIPSDKAYDYSSIPPTLLDYSE